MLQKIHQAKSSISGARMFIYLLELRHPSTPCFTHLEQPFPNLWMCYIALQFFPIVLQKSCQELSQQAAMKPLEVQIKGVEDIVMATIHWSWSWLDQNPIRSGGTCITPLTLRFIENWASRQFLAIVPLFYSTLEQRWPCITPTPTLCHKCLTCNKWNCFLNW